MSEAVKEKEEKMPLEAQFAEYLIDKRRVFLCEAVDDKIVSQLIKQFWFLESKDSKKPIYFFINSPGGSVTAGMALYDVIQMLKVPVYTIVTGLAASMGSVLSLVAPKGKRFATRNARLMIHQPLVSGVIQGQATDIEIHAQEIIKVRERLIEIYVEATGRKAEEIGVAIDRDKWLSADEAVEFGLVDQLISSFDQLDES